MYKAIVTGSLVGSAYIFCLTTNLFDNALMFLLFGITPNHATQLPAATMLQAYEIASIILLVVLLRHQLWHAFAVLPRNASHAIVSKKPVAKSRRLSARPTRPKAAVPLTQTVLHPMHWRLGASKR